MNLLSKVKNKWEGIPLAAKASTAYAICSIVQRCLSFITLPLFTRLMTTEQYGQYTIYISWQSILSIVLTLNMAYGSFSTAMVKFEDDRDGYISSIQSIWFILLGVFAIIYFPFKNFWNGVMELSTPLVMLLVAEIIFTNAISLWAGKKRFEYKYKSIILETIAVSIASPLLAYILVINSEDKGVARILGYALVSIATGVFFLVLNYIRGRKYYDRTFWKYAFGFNLPLIAYYLSQVVFNQSDRIMISHLNGTDKAAMYGIAYNFATILSFILNAINNSYVPWFYGKIKEGKEEENKRVSCGIAILMAVLILAIIWFAPEIILIMAGEQYREAIGVVLPVAMSLLLLFYAQLFINVEFYYEEKLRLIWASVGAAVLNIVLNYWMIPIFGFVAAGYTTLVSYIVFAGANYFTMKSVLKKKYEKKFDAFDIRILLVIFIAFAIISAAGALLYNYLVVRIIIAVIVLVSMIVLRKRLFSFWNVIKKEKSN